VNLSSIAREIHAAGVTRIHSFAWRDLDDPEAGGSEVHADQILRRWASVGLEITHRTSTSNTARQFERNGYRVIQKSGRYGVFPSAIAQEIRAGKSSRDAVLEIWNGVPWFSQLWSRVPRTVWLHHVHGPMWKQSLPPGFAQLGNILESRIAPPFYRQTPIVTLADSGRAELIHLGFPAKNVHVVNPGVDDSFSVDDTVSKTSAPSLVAVGRLAPVKRFDLLIDSVSTARKVVPNLRLTIVGDGPDRAQLERKINDQQHDWVHLAGRLETPELIDLYRRSWLLVSMSLAEGWGMTITEAAACGTPSVVIDNSGHRDATVHGVTGLVSDSIEEFSRDLVRALQDPELLQKLAHGAVERSHLLRWDHAAAATLSHLRDEIIRRND
jgi:glycosyltransferase involved in cell wall biosynthesis